MTNPSRWQDLDRERPARVIPPVRILAAVGLVLAVAASGSAPIAEDDPLPRRTWLGAQLQPAQDGVGIRATLPGSSAAAAGLQPGDILQSINTTNVRAIPELIAALRSIKSTDEVAFHALRDGKPVDLTTKLLEWPREDSSPAFQVVYGSVESTGGRLRTITNVPRQAASGAPPRFPGFVIVQGLGMASLDNPTPDRPIGEPVGMGVYRAIAGSLAEAGFVTLRIDKAGCGDSEGAAARLDFPTELDGYIQAIRALKARADIDPARIYLFGHSMGGVFAPLIAERTPIRGLAVYGTVLKPWHEYMLENSRRQAILAGMDQVEYDRSARQAERFSHEFLVEGREPRAILAETPELRASDTGSALASGDTLFGRHYSFFQQLHQVSLPELWSKYEGHVLAIWGNCDFVSGRDDHEQIAAIAERRDAGKGRFIALEGIDHGFDKAASPLDAMRQSPLSPGDPSRFHPLIIDTLKSWALEVEKS